MSIENRIRIENPKFAKLRKSEILNTCIWSPSLILRGQIDLSRDEQLHNEMPISIEKSTETSVKIELRLNVNVKLNCPDFDYDWFPFDKQECSVILFTNDPETKLNGVIGQVQPSVV